MKKIKTRLPVVVFLLVIFGLGIWGLSTKTQTYSQTEKRQLQTFPKLSKKTIEKGSFQKKYETYLSDQFPMRDDWVRLQTTVTRLLGKKEVNGVYFGKDAYLLEKYTKDEFESRQAKKNLRTLAAFVKQARQTAQVKVMIVPTKTWILRDHLPAFAPGYEESDFYDALKTALGDENEDVLVPVDEILESHKTEPVYYRTDHHWTTYGAWLGYLAYTQAAGGDVAQASAKKQLKTVSDHFYGTTYAKVNQAKKADEIEVYEPKTALTVTYNLGEKTTDSLYEYKYLDTEDAYRVFTGGNQAVLEITGGTKNNKTLFVVKDSFANCMLPFLAEDYEKVVVVDPRQLNVGCGALLEMFQPTDVLILYNSAQFAEDKSLKM